MCKEIILKKNIFVRTAILLLSVSFIFAADVKKSKETVGDDIFRSVKAETSDFYKLSVEPSKKELMAGVQSQLSDIKKQRLKVIQDSKNQKKNISDTAKANKKEILDARTQMAKDLEEQRASIYGKKPKANKTPKKPVEAVEAEKKEIQAKKPEESVEEQKKKIQAKKPEEKAEPSEKVQENIKKSNDIQKAEVALNTAEETRKTFIGYGLNLQGTRYVYGGTTPIPGMDCSGFIQYAAKNSIGLQLPRTAQNMYDAATKISAEEAQPGDLVFFKDGWKVSHVGIYLGNNQIDNEFRKGKIFLNAASGGPRTGVIVSGMNEPYWNRTFCGYGRILPKI